MMAEKMKIPELVRELRTRAGMTQHQLEEAAGLAWNSVGRIERGVIDIKGTHLLRIIEVTGHEFVIRRASNE